MNIHENPFVTVTSPSCRARFSVQDHRLRLARFAPLPHALTTLRVRVLDLQLDRLAPTQKDHE